MQEFSQNFCTAGATDFSNFVYQIDMTILQGQTGGIIFRGTNLDNSRQTYYDFQMSADGQYSLYRSDLQHSSDIIIGQGSSAAINQGNNKHNILAVIAIGTSLSLYVNFRLVTHIVDPTCTHGSIGVMTTADGASLTELIFRNAKVWKI
jgi:hypothetical protein